MDNTGITTSACINNRIVNCKAPGIYIYNCQDNYLEILNCQIDNLTIFVSRSCFIKDCFINKKYNIDGNNLLSNISPTSFSPGSTLYDNERKQYIYTNGINWKLF